MFSEGCRCGLATNVIWKAVPGSRSCIREGPLIELGKCTRHAASSCCRNSLYSVWEIRWRSMVVNGVHQCAELNCTRDLTGSQCSCIRYGETWSRWRKSNTSRAAAFCRRSTYDRRQQNHVIRMHSTGANPNSNPISALEALFCDDALYKLTFTFTFITLTLTNANVYDGLRIVNS